MLIMNNKDENKFNNNNGNNFEKNYNNYKFFLTPKGEKLRRAASNFIK